MQHRHKDCSWFSWFNDDHLNEIKAKSCIGKVWFEDCEGSVPTEVNCASGPGGFVAPCAATNLFFIARHLSHMAIGKDESAQEYVNSLPSPVGCLLDVFDAVYKYQHFRNSVVLENHSEILAWISCNQGPVQVMVRSSCYVGKVYLSQEIRNNQLVCNNQLVHIDTWDLAIGYTDMSKFERRR